MFPMLCFACVLFMVFFTNNLPSCLNLTVFGPWTIKEALWVSQIHNPLG